jgi:hypothetical protein
VVMYAAATAPFLRPTENRWRSDAKVVADSADVEIAMPVLLQRPDGGQTDSGLSD